MDEQPEETKFVVVGDYLCEDINECNCGPWPYAHELYCGIEPIIKMDKIEGLDKYIKYKSEPEPVITITGLSQGLKNAIYMAIGAASTCWIPNTGSAVFDSTQAKAIGDELVEKIEKELRSGV